MRVASQRDTTIIDSGVSAIDKVTAVPAGPADLVVAADTTVDVDGMILAKPADLDADIPTKALVARLALNEGTGIPAGTTAAGEPVTWKKDGKSGPAPAFKKGSHLVIGEAGNFSTKQAFSAAAWARPDKLEGNGTIVGVAYREREGARMVGVVDVPARPETLPLLRGVA